MQNAGGGNGLTEHVVQRPSNTRILTNNSGDGGLIKLKVGDKQTSETGNEFHIDGSNKEPWKDRSDQDGQIEGKHHAKGKRGPSHVSQNFLNNLTSNY